MSGHLQNKLNNGYANSDIDRMDISNEIDVCIITLEIFPNLDTALTVAQSKLTNRVK